MKLNFINGDNHSNSIKRHSEKMRGFSLLKKLLFIFPILLNLFACDALNKPEVEVEAMKLNLPASLQVKVTQDNDFAFELLRQTIAHNEDENVFLSPLSVSIALGMALNGAENETAEQMASTLRLSGLTGEEINEYYKIMQSTLPFVDPKTKLSIANSLWYHESFSVKPDFLKVNADNFNAYIKMLDFRHRSSVDTINNWCSRSTKGLIPKMIDKIPENAVMYLMNAVYFKGLWAMKFDKKNTAMADFTNEKGKKTPVNMMSIMDNFAYSNDGKAQYLRMPYGNSSYNMTIVLPAENQTVDNVLSDISADTWSSRQEKMYVKAVQVYMPRLKVENFFSLKDVLSDMGMPLIFNDLADFSGISDDQISVSDVKHKTYVTIDEEGTEAAAITSVEFVTTAMPTPTEVRINKPFVFVISEKSTGIILFTAKIGNPGKY